MKKWRLNKKKFFLRLFLVVILPLFIYIWLFSSLNPNNYQFKQITKGNILDDNCPSLKCSLRDVLNVPFKYDYYNFCFIDGGKSNVYPYWAQISNGENIKTFNITFKSNNNCEIVDLRLGIKTLFEDWTSGPINLTEDKTILIQLGGKDLQTKIEPEFWSGLTKIFLVFLACWGTLFLLREVKKYLNESFLKKGGELYEKEK